MMSPSSPEELAEIVRSTPRLQAVGSGTKPRLYAPEVPRVSITALTGIVEYDPSEFTFTARAGTPLREITAALAEKGQYLPFDPMLVEAGATLGGTIAAGLSGPGRFRFGGIRDFILGVRFVDGMGRLLRMGGKVVKNAAGFDLPKFFVGSLGRFGLLAEVTFKVFPRPPASRTLKLTLDSVEDAARVLTDAANTRWEPEALDLLPDGQSVLLRLAAPAAALEAISAEILARWLGVVLSEEEARTTWQSIGEFRWAYGDGALLKAPITPADVSRLHRSFDAKSGGRLHVSAGGNVSFLSFPAEKNAAEIDTTLRESSLSALTLRGHTPARAGRRSHFEIDAAVKSALDPDSRFPSLEA